MASNFCRASSVRALAGSAMVGLIAAAMSPAAMAEETDQQASAQDSGGLQEIVVTAQRRSQSQQDVPISINVLTRESQSAAGITDTNSLSGKIPGLTVTDFGSKIYFLRGVGTTGTSVNQDQSVALYLDGVYLSSPWASSFPISSVERTEVLKGPQGTLFGRNTTGGVVQFISRDPDRNALEASAGYGNYNTVTASAYAAARLGENLGANVSVDFRDQGDGWGRNTTRNEKNYFHNSFSFQTKWVWQATEDTKVTALYWYDREKGSGLNAQLQRGEIGLDGVTHPLGRYQTIADTPDSDYAQAHTGYIRIDKELGFADLVSLSSYRRTKDDFRLDQDTTTLTVVNARLLQNTENFSQELQMLSPADSKIKWLVGAYYFTGVAGYYPISIAGFAIGPSPTAEVQFFQEQQTDSLAGFGQVTVPLGEGTNLTGGLRYTYEKQKEVSSTNIVGAFSFANDDQVAHSNGWTWRAAVDHKFSSDLMVYASYNRGLRSGGFELVTATNEPAYRPEKLDAYEVGFKSELLDHRLRFNASAFYYKFKDIQVQRIIGGATFIQNATSATIKGFEADIEARPTNELTLSGSVSILDGKYGDFPTATRYDKNPAGGRIPITFNAKDQDTIYTPPFSAAFSAIYKIPLDSFNVSIDGSVQYASRQYTGPDNIGVIPKHTLVNAGLAFGTSNDKYRLRFWAANLFDEKYLNNVLEEAVGNLQVPGAPRTYGATFSVKY